MQDKILELLRQSGGFVSGEYIGSKLNISRAAVGKYIARLRQLGYRIDAVSSKGYMFIDDNNVLSLDNIGIKNCVYLSEVDSTNLEAKRIAAEDFEDKLLIVCGRQTGGRGRLDRTWTDNGEDVCMSCLFKPDIPPVDVPALTLAAGLAVADALEELTGLSLGIKWPNDVILNGKKLVGILTEMSAEMDHINYAVTGIGINVNRQSFDGELKDKATSLAIELGHTLKRSEVIRRCVPRLYEYYDIFCAEGFAALADKYTKKCINIGKTVKAIYRNRTLTAFAKGVDTDGSLIADDMDGNEIKISSGEVSLRLENDKYI